MMADDRLWGLRLADRPLRRERTIERCVGFKEVVRGGRLRCTAAAGYGSSLSAGGTVSRRNRRHINDTTASARQGVHVQPRRTGRELETYEPCTCRGFSGPKQRHMDFLCGIQVSLCGAATAYHLLFLLVGLPTVLSVKDGRDFDDELDAVKRGLDI